MLRITFIDYFLENSEKVNLFINYYNVLINIAILLFRSTYLCVRN